VFDATTPLSPNGGMFWARPEALAKLAEYPFDFADFKAGPDGYRDGQLTHVLERLYGYAALDSGFTLRVVANQDWAAIDYPLLEYKLASVASLLPAFAEEQLGYVKRLQAIEQAERDWRPAMPAQAFKHALAVHRPRLARLLFPGYQPPPGRGTAN